MAEEQEDIDSLKRRGRRRLVGAVALVLAAVIVLPMVFDPAPKSSAPPVSVRIPGEDDTAFKPKLAAKVEPPPPPVAKAEPKVEAPPPKPEPKVEPSPPPPAPKAEPPKIPVTEKARAEAALKGEQYFVPVGAYANPQAVIAKLTEAKVPYYTEDLAVKGGKVTRVRAGPFNSKEAAESMAGKLKTLGLQPGSVAAKAG